MKQWCALYVFLYSYKTALHLLQDVIWLSYVWAYNPRGQYTLHVYNRYEEGYRNGI